MRGNVQSEKEAVDVGSALGQQPGSATFRHKGQHAQVYQPCWEHGRAALRHWARRYAENDHGVRDAEQQRIQWCQEDTSAMTSTAILSVEIGTVPCRIR